MAFVRRSDGIFNLFLISEFLVPCFYSAVSLRRGPFHLEVSGEFYKILCGTWHIPKWFAAISATPVCSRTAVETSVQEKMIIMCIFNACKRSNCFVQLQKSGDLLGHSATSINRMKKLSRRNL